MQDAKAAKNTTKRRDMNGHPPDRKHHGGADCPGDVRVWGHKGFEEMKGFKVFKDIKVSKDLRDPKDLRDFRDLKVLNSLRKPYPGWQAAQSQARRLAEDSRRVSRASSRAGKKS